MVEKVNGLLGGLCHINVDANKGLAISLPLGQADATMATYHVPIQLSIFMLESHSSDKDLPYLMGLSEGENLACQLIIIVSLFCGTFFRLLVLRVVKQNGWFKLPINTLIFLDQVFSISAYSLLLLISLAVTLIGERPLADYTGREFCEASSIAISIGLYTSTWLRLGIATLRLVYFSQAKKVTIALLLLEQWGPLGFSAAAITFGTITGNCVILMKRIGSFRNSN